MNPPPTMHACDYCGLTFHGPGCSPDGKGRYCCYGCYLVQRIVLARGEEGGIAWITVRLGIGAFLSMNVMMINLLFYTQSPGDFDPATLSALYWAMLVLSTPALAILGAPFFLSSARDLLRFRISMDVLISTGALAAFIVSVINVARGSGQIYFDTATMLLLIITVGRLIEASTKSRTSRAIREMMELTPKTAHVLRDGEEVEVPADEIARGETVVVRPGEHIPSDGIIRSGTCLAEETPFTGEVMPRACGPGDRVFGGSVNVDGFLTVEATAVGAESVLAQIREMVRRAQEERAPVELLAERAASAFVPVVWLVALGALAYWGGARHDIVKGCMSALAVLVVACPCALGLATPLVTCIAIGKAARAGVLIRSGDALERLPRVGRVFFDKTGTLTTGRPAVGQINTSGVTETEALTWAGSLATASEHTAARAIAAEARSHGITLGQVSDFRTHSGMGIEGVVIINGTSRRVAVGSLKLLARDHVVPEELARAAEEDASTLSMVGWDGKARAVISLADSIRPEAIKTVDALRKADVEVAIISGDRQAPTRKVAEELGVENVYWECTPAEKAELIHKVSDASGRFVVMVGDGINDAPALAEADIGIATGGGTDLARECGDITLLGDDLSRIPWTLELSRTAYRLIRQNLWWAFGYNAAAISLAFFGFLHPLIAATAMVLSSVAVITNSMRLTR